MKYQKIRLSDKQIEKLLSDIQKEKQFLKLRKRIRNENNKN